MPHRIYQTTDAVAVHERWDFWKDTTLAAVEAAPVGEADDFRARRSITQTAHGTLIDTVSKPMALRRPRERIARDGIDHACLVVGLAGSGIIDQLGRAEVAVAAGDMVLYDLGRPYVTTSLEDYHELRLYVPRDHFAARVGRIETLSGLLIPGAGGLGRMFTRYLAAYAAELPALSARDAEAGMDGVLHLLSGLVGRALDARAQEGADLGRVTLLALAQRHIHSLLADPKLDVSLLARTVGVSRTKLYEAFADQGGIAAVIRDARLERARQRLASPTDRGRTIEAIASLCGFTDHATFTRAFQRRFGMPPRAARSS